MTNDHVYEHARSILHKVGIIEDVLRYLRSEGVTQGQSALFLVEHAGFEDDAAANTVRCSLTWADRRGGNDELSRAFLSAASRFGRPGPDGSIDLTDWTRSDSDA